MSPGRRKYLPATIAAGTCGVVPPRVASLALLLVFLTVVLLGCITPLPRPGETVPVSPSPEVPATPIPANSPIVAPTTPAEPVPSATPVPTATSPLDPATATPPPTATPPLDPATATPPPTPAPTEDSGGLMLQVYAPEEGATIPGSAVTVYGQTTPGTRIFISGDEAEVDAEGGFRADVSLAPAENEVIVTAVGVAGQRKSVVRTVTSLALPFLLLVTEPCNECIVPVSTVPISGRTGPNAIVSINGRSVPVDRFGYFSSTARLEEGPNIIDVVATNHDGQTFSTVLAVIHRAPGE